MGSGIAGRPQPDTACVKALPVNGPPGDPLGTHRVLSPAGALPQPAERLDADTSRLYETEITVDVETLNIDAASFRQMEEASAGDPEGVARLVLDTVARRGKQHNPVTGSGGMLLGVVRRTCETGYAQNRWPGTQRPRCSARREPGGR